MREMNSFQFEKFSDLIDQYITEGYVDIRTDYSGRGMFGDPCLGVVVPSDQSKEKLSLILAMVLKMEDEDDGGITFAAHELLEILDGLPGMRSDNMGLDVIYYWPSIKVEEGDEN